jgi:hypothetical protein
MLAATETIDDGLMDMNALDGFLVSLAFLVSMIRCSVPAANIWRFSKLAQASKLWD